MGGGRRAVGASEKLGGNYCRTRKHLDFPNKTQTVVCEEWSTPRTDYNRILHRDLVRRRIK